MDFIKNIPEHVALFRGISDRNNIISNWFCLNLPDTDQYGPRKFVFKPNKILRLIDLTNIKFHDDYLSKVNNLFGNNIDKLYCLIPIGLPDYDTQIKFMSIIGHPLPNSNHTLAENDTIKLNCLQNKSRYSEYNIDKSFVDILKHIYGAETDGYIIPNPWPTKIGNGIFRSEAYVYDTSNISLLHEIPQSGGKINNIKNINKNNHTFYTISKEGNGKMENLYQFPYEPIEKGTPILQQIRIHLTKEQENSLNNLQEILKKNMKNPFINSSYISTPEKENKSKKQFFGGKTRKRKNK